MGINSNQIEDTVEQGRAHNVGKRPPFFNDHTYFNLNRTGTPVEAAIVSL
ncbi:hypothetical protein VDG1235_2320 [Verrucomicrobiia bacterium DG1235]|nr:hypothetical protein VDG1235_2320 [Verrucomicrobiae bacterium DG1235]